MREGWGVWVEPLRQATFAVYERDPAATEPWFQLYRWARLFATPRARAIEAWIRAVETAGVAHANLASRYELPPGSVAAEVSPALQRWVIGHQAFSREFFSLRSEVDQPLAVLAILTRLHGANPAQFAEYASLALAIALVYDVPPPPDWPHGQVSAQLLPRRLPGEIDAFNHFVRLDRTNASLHRLKRLPAAELKFVVDVSAPLADLVWAQRQVPTPLSQLATTYDAIRYRKDRIEQASFAWPHANYRLETILKEGGICVDQAYYAANAGKARGVPTLLFRGAGLDGRHAWFGYLGANGWVLDAGRYAEQQYVAGVAHDPQTWRNFTDHELLFLTERFRVAPLYQLSQIHAGIAVELLAAGNPDAALRAARESVNRERRNVDGWRVLLEAQRVARVAAPVREGTLREAMQAFQRYPDLEVTFARQLVESLRARGERSLADAEERRIALKHRSTRGDLSIQQAGEVMQRSLREHDLAGIASTYRRLLETQGRGAGIDFFDKVVIPYVDRLVREQQIPAARDALQRARATLRVEKGSQLEREIERALHSLRPKP